MDSKTLMGAVVTVDAICWGALIVFAIHFFTCPMA